VVVGDVPGALEACGGVNGVQDFEVNLRAWTACSIASNRGREEWLETGATSVSFWASIPCGTERGEGVRRCAGERGERGGPEGSGGVLDRAEIGDEQWQNQRAPARNLCGLAALFGGGERGKAEGLSGFL
jgi:hypothetical protein